MICALTLLFAASVIPATEATQTALLETFRHEFIHITPGKDKYPESFVMGSKESGTKKVSFDYSFSIAKYEVPQNLWKSVMGSNPSTWKGERNSVEKLSFDEAVQFCKKITALMRTAKLIDETQEVRLPNEAEWEYTARAGTKTIYSFGKDRGQLDQYAWSTHNAAGNDPPVGALKPNPWGLYDVHGYLWEWCYAYTPSTAKKVDVKKADAKRPNGAQQQKAVSTGSDHQVVLRGGSWKDAAEKLTSDYRVVAPRDSRDDAVGLRCVLAKVKK